MSNAARKVPEDKTGDNRLSRRTRAHAVSRTAILDAARRVAARSGARDLSLRAVAAEAGFAPAALYGYFRGKDELLLALAADDLSQLARVLKEAVAKLKQLDPNRALLQQGTFDQLRDNYFRSDRAKSRFDARRVRPD